MPKEKAKEDAILERPCEMISIRCQRLQLAAKATLIPLFEVLFKQFWFTIKLKEVLKLYVGTLASNKSTKLFIILPLEGDFLFQDTRLILKDSGVFCSTLLVPCRKFLF